jgi:dihydrofolate reductase
MILWHTTMSLDGFIAGPADGMDWVFRYDGPNAEVDEVIRGTGALLVGRRSYDVGHKEGTPAQARKAFGGAWTGPQFVLTHHPPEGEEDPTITFVTGDIRSAVARAREAADGKNVVLIGASVARQCIEAGLVDEILVHLVPILLGDGVRFYGSADSGQVDLRVISVTRSGEVTNLRFRVQR